jgi:hypothetical protein
VSLCLCGYLPQLDDYNYMHTKLNAEPVELSISGRLQELLRTSVEVFDQPDDVELAARPMGLDVETCRLAADVCRRLLKEESVTLQPPELKALFHALEFARRELCSELHTEMRDLQKTMASIVTSRSPAEIESLADKLPREAEQATRRLRAVLKKRRALLEDSEALIKKIRSHLKLPGPVK